MIKKILIIKLINLSCLLHSMNIEGFYESQIGRTQESDSFDWNIWDSNFYLETRMFGNPNNNTSYYIKFYPYKDYNKDCLLQTGYQLTSSHHNVLILQNANQVQGSLAFVFVY